MVNWEAYPKSQRLSCLLGSSPEDYQIGAAYFLKADVIDFDKLWTDHLEPLLKDYIRGMSDEKETMNNFAKAYGYPSIQGNSDETRNED